MQPSSAPRVIHLGRKNKSKPDEKLFKEQVVQVRRRLRLRFATHHFNASRLGRILELR